MKKSTFKIAKDLSIVGYVITAFFVLHCGDGTPAPEGRKMISEICSETLLMATELKAPVCQEELTNTAYACEPLCRFIDEPNSAVVCEDKCKDCGTEPCGNSCFNQCIGAKETEKRRQTNLCRDTAVGVRFACTRKIKEIARQYFNLLPQFELF